MWTFRTFFIIRMKSENKTAWRFNIQTMLINESICMELFFYFDFVNLSNVCIRHFCLSLVAIYLLLLFFVMKTHWKAITLDNCDNCDWAHFQKRWDLVYSHSCCHIYILCVSDGESVNVIFGFGYWFVRKRTPGVFFSSYCVL